VRAWRDRAWNFDRRPDARASTTSTVVRPVPKTNTWPVAEVVPTPRAPTDSRRPPGPRDRTRSLPMEPAPRQPGSSHGPCRPERTPASLSGSHSRPGCSDRCPGRSRVSAKWSIHSGSAVECAPMCLGDRGGTAPGDKVAGTEQAVYRSEPVDKMLWLVVQGAHRPRRCVQHVLGVVRGVGRSGTELARGINQQNAPRPWAGPGEVHGGDDATRSPADNGPVAGSVFRSALTRGW
jgi:hypothetical protein